MAEKNKKYRAANLEKMKEKSRAYHKTNREVLNKRTREYMRVRPEMNRAGGHRRRAMKRRNGCRPYKERDIFRRDKNTCQLCCTPIDMGIKWPDSMSPSLDHIIPISKGGPDTAENVQAAHLSCNVSKGAKLPATLF